MSHFDKLRVFRHQAYCLMGNGRDALFDLMDAVLVSRSVYSFAELSLSPVFRRQWPSLYESLQDSNPPRGELMGLYLEQIPQDDRDVLAGDHTAWSRLQAETLRERTYEHQATPMSQQFQIRNDFAPFQRSDVFLRKVKPLLDEAFEP